MTDRRENTLLTHELASSLCVAAGGMLAATAFLLFFGHVARTDLRDMSLAALLITCVCGAGAVAFFWQAHRLGKRIIATTKPEQLWVSRIGIVVLGAILVALLALLILK